MSRADEAFRALMRQVPLPVAVVTAAGTHEKRGVTIGSFTGVSIDPPLISFNIMRVSRMHPVITQAERFAVHILADDQAAVSVLFAKPDYTGTQQFAAVSHTLDPDGVPLLGDTVGILHCTIHALHQAGDHSIVVGEVLYTTDGPRSRPLLYHKGAYRRLGQRIVESMQALP